MGEVLPAAAARRADWPIRRDHCFARVVLDNVYDAPWRDRIAPPAWRHMDEAHLARAVELARRVVEGEADLRELNRRSLGLRGKLRE